MSVVVSSEPAKEPISLDEAKAHLIVEHSRDDEMISRIVKAARQWVEQVTWRRLITQTLQLRLPRFPCRQILVPFPRLQSVTSISYIDTNGSTQTWAADQRQVDIYGEPGVIEPAYGVTYPATRCVQNAVTVTFVAGYGDDETDVPEPIRAAILSLVAHWYQNREIVVVGTIAEELSLHLQAQLGPFMFRDERILEFV